jgi:hypothetical protein
MKITRCRFWRCPECGARQEKKGLADLLRRQRDGESLAIRAECRCARCAAISRGEDVYAGEFDAPSRAEAIPPEDDIEVALLDEPGPEEEEEHERKKRRHLHRYRGLKQVNRGLVIHYGGMLTFLAGVAVGWVGLAVLASTAVLAGAEEDPEAAAARGFAAAAFLFSCSWGLTALSGLMDLVASGYCLGVPDPLARKCLAWSMVARMLALAFGVVFLLFRLPGLAELITSFLAVVGWLLWVGFLWGLADCLNYPVLGEEAVGVTWSALYLVITWIVVTCFSLIYLLITLLLARIGGFFPCMSPLAVAALIAGIIRYLLATGKFESPWTLILYPTGIPLVLRYLNLIGTTRMIILRRS